MEMRNVRINGGGCEWVSGGEVSRDLDFAKRWNGDMYGVLRRTSLAALSETGRFLLRPASAQAG